MSDTPRTDEKAHIYFYRHELENGFIDFARDLERENAKLREEMDASQKKLSSADREIERLNLLNRMLSLDSKEDKKNRQAITQLRANLAAANARAEAEQAAGKEYFDLWADEQTKVSQLEKQNDALRKALEECKDALTYGGDRLVALINAERSKCKGDHWDFWNYLAEKLRNALTTAKSALPKAGVAETPAP